MAAIEEEGGEVAILLGDVCVGNECEVMVKAAVERYGGLHVLVNNLGYRGRGGGTEAWRG